MNANAIWRSIVSEAKEHAAGARMYLSMCVRFKMQVQHVYDYHKYHANKG